MDESIKRLIREVIREELNLRVVGGWNNSTSDWTRNLVLSIGDHEIAQISLEELKDT